MAFTKLQSQSIDTNITVVGVVTANAFYGDGSNLTGIGYASTAGIATYANSAGVSTDVIGGIASVSQLIVSGVSTLGNVKITSGIVTATSGIITYYGDGSQLSNIVSGIGINTSGGNVGYGATILDFRGSGISTITVSSGIATINIEGGTGVSTAASNYNLTLSPGFDGITTAFGILYGASSYYPTNEQQLIVSLGGVVQKPGIAYTISSSVLYFANPPNAETDYFIVALNTSNESTFYTTNYSTSSGIATYAASAGIVTYSSISGVSTYATSAGIATYATTAGIATYATNAGVSTYAASAGIATYSSTAGVSTYATSAGIATYATTAGVSTDVIGGIGSLTQLSVSGVSTLGNVKIGIGTTALIVEGDARITGILTIGTSSVTIDGINNQVNVGSGVTIHHTNGVQVGNNTLHSTGLTINQVNVTGVITASNFVGAVSGTASTATSAATAYGLDGTPNINVGVVTATSFSGNGSSLTNLNASNLSSGIVPAARITETSPLNVNGDLYVSGNISFGGTTTQLNTNQLTFSDPDLVLGVGTTSTFNPTDNTANHGGIAIASTEGSPLVDLNIIPQEVLPTTYKKIMWFKNNTAGLGTDAWLFNYAIGIGSTQFPTGTRFAAGNIQLDANDVKVVRHISASGIITATSFSGNASSATYATTAGIATYSTSSGIATNVSGGIASVNEIQVTGVSTFTNGPVFVGSATSTGTASQRLQVTGGGYFSGSVGIGTTSPQERIHSITNGTTSFIRIENSSSLRAYYGVNSSGDVEVNAADNSNLVFKTFGTERGRFTSDGNLGIGTTNPQEALHVVGVVTATSYRGDGSQLTGVSVGTDITSCLFS